MGGRRRRGDTTRYIDEEEREICPSSSRLNCCWSGNVSIKWVVPSVTRWTISLWSLTNQSLRDKSRNRVYHLFFIRNHRSSARTNLLLSSSITRRCEPNELPAHSVRQSSIHSDTGGVGFGTETDLALKILSSQAIGSGITIFI